MNSQKFKKEIYPENFTEDDKLTYDILFEQSKQLFPKLCNDEWLIRMGIIAYMEKEKRGECEPPSQEDIAKIKNQYSDDKVYYTEETTSEN